jgi:endo-alpha-1,4-polygalactosaminidase (GH114 family)
VFRSLPRSSIIWLLLLSCAEGGGRSQILPVPSPPDASPGVRARDARVEPAVPGILDAAADHTGHESLPADAGVDAPADTPPRWRPARGNTWQWQLTEELDLSAKADVWDVDLFQTTAEQVAQLHARGAKVVCYLNAGSWESWRSDKDRFPPEVIGLEQADWPGEKWLDIRQIDKLAPVMSARFDLCQQKGFDGVEADNMDGFLSPTGFPLTEDDQIRYNRWLADQAHRRGLSIALKNTKELARTLQPDFDWAMIESCFSDGDWCGDLAVFLLAGKAVFMAEYVEQEVDWDEACERATTLGYSAILKNRDLDAWLEPCQP